MTESEPKTVASARVIIAWLLGAQVVFVLLLAPCDGGRWQTLTLLFLPAFDIFFCLLLYGVAKIRRDRSSGISLLAAVLFVIGSIATAVVGTYAMEGLHL